MNIEYLLLALSGLLLHYLGRWKEVVEMKYKVEFFRELPTLLMSLLITVILIYIGDDMKDIYPLTPATAVLLGYGNQSLFNKILKIKGVKNDTDDKP